MLSRTSRLAAALAIMAGALFLSTPEPAIANNALACGDSGTHTCCIYTDDCGGRKFCCVFYEGGPTTCGCAWPV